MTKQKQTKKREEITVTWHDPTISPEESQKRLDNMFDILFAEVIKRRQNPTKTERV